MTERTLLDFSCPLDRMVFGIIGCCDYEQSTSTSAKRCTPCRAVIWHDHVPRDFLESITQKLTALSPSTMSAPPTDTYFIAVGATRFHCADVFVFTNLQCRVVRWHDHDPGLFFL